MFKFCSNLSFLLDEMLKKSTSCDPHGSRIRIQLTLWIWIKMLNKKEYKGEFEMICLFSARFKTFFGIWMEFFGCIRIKKKLDPKPCPTFCTHRQQACACREGELVQQENNALKRTSGHQVCLCEWLLLLPGSSNTKEGGWDPHHGLPPHCSDSTGIYYICPGIKVWRRWFFKNIYSR